MWYGVLFTVASTLSLNPQRNDKPLSSKEGGGKIFCHLVIDLNKELCASSDEGETCAEIK